MLAEEVLSGRIKDGDNAEVDVDENKKIIVKHLDKKDVYDFYKQDHQMRLLITKEHKCPVDFKLIPPDRHKAKYDIWKQNTKARIHKI